MLWKYIYLPLMADKGERRKNREDALRKLNMLADRAGLSKIALRAPSEQVVELYSSLCEELHDFTELAAAREKYVSNGGVELEESLMNDTEQDSGENFPGGEEPVLAHRRLNTSGQSFRLRARAFMLTFNSIAFTASQLLFESFVAWAEERRQRFDASSADGFLKVLDSLALWE